MNKKRIVSLSILAALLLGQLAACGDTPSSSNDTTDPQGTDTTEPIIEAEYVKPDVNYNGDTVTIASFNFDFTYAIANYTMINHDEETGDTLNDSIVKMTRQVEEDLNINLEMFELLREDRFKNEKLTKSMHAGDDDIQIAFPMAGGLTGILGEPELLVDLNTISTLDLSHSWWDQKAINEYEIGGVQYTAVGDVCFFAKASPVITFFNKQLVEDNKLDDPYQLVYDGKWTIDKMIEMGTAAARDLNDNQKADEKEDLFGFLGQSSTLPYMMSASEVKYISRDKDDNFELDFSLDKAAIIAEKLVPFFRDKSITLYADDWYGIYNKPDPFEGLLQPAFMENRGLFFSNQLLLALDFRAMEADFGILPLPKYDEIQENYYSFPTGAWCDCVMVPSTNKDLEQAGYVLEAMGYYSQQYVTPAFIETTVLDKSMRDEDSEKMVNLILENMVYDIATLFDWGGMESMITKMCNNKSINIASEYDKIKPAILDAMNKAMEALNG